MRTEIYPKYQDNDDAIIYFVEFGRGGKENSFTVFQRSFIFSKGKWESMAKSKDPFMSREGHPYQLFDGFYGFAPSRKWVEWMIDTLNREHEKHLLIDGKFNY